jgi:hypothetical protein
MARPGLEPGTPRFSVVRPFRLNTCGLQGISLHWRMRRVSGLSRTLRSFRRGYGRRQGASAFSQRSVRTSANPGDDLFVIVRASCALDHPRVDLHVLAARVSPLASRKRAMRRNAARLLVSGVDGSWRGAQAGRRPARRDRDTPRRRRTTRTEHAPRIPRARCAAALRSPPGPHRAGRRQGERSRRAMAASADSPAGVY